MSLEDAITKLTAAVEENTKALKAGGGSSGNSGAGKASGGSSSTGKKATTLDQVAKAFGAYLSAEGDDGKAVVKKINAHFDVKKISDLDASKFDEALALLEQVKNGEDPFDSGDGGLL